MMKVPANDGAYMFTLKHIWVRVRGRRFANFNGLRRQLGSTCDSSGTFEVKRQTSDSTIQRFEPPTQSHTETGTHAIDY
jgi:hypothetical protein